MQTVLLSSRLHDRHRFDCGVEALNNYLKVMANQHSKKDSARTFVLEHDKEPGRIIGFYTLTMVTMDVSALLEALQKKYGQSMSAGLIARLAVDKQFKGRRLGEWLLVDALKKLLSASDEVGFPFVVVDAKQGMESFYQQYGFQPFLNESNRLFMTLADIRKSV